MREVLKSSKRTKKYIDSLPKIYLVACLARFGVTELPFTGKFVKSKRIPELYVPLVYQYDDHNGTADNYYLREIIQATTGQIVIWTQNRNIANKIAAMYNNHMV